MAAKTTARKAKAKTAPVEPEISPEEDFDSELVEAEDDGDELEELEEDEVADEAPAAKGKKKSANDEITFGIQDLCKLVKTETGDDVNPRGMRTLIRKMARDETGRVDREIVPGNRSRYNWTGPNDPEVRAILEAYKGGELEVEKKAKLDALKERKAAQDAAKKKKVAAAEVDEDDDEDETPAPKKTAKKAAAPAKKRRKAPVVEEVEDDEELDLDDDGE
jgi:hypothetical protein